MPATAAPLLGSPLFEPGVRRSINPRRLRRALGASMAEAMVAESVVAFAGGAVLTGWALHLGCGASGIGVLGALPIAATATSRVLWGLLPHLLLPGLEADARRASSASGPTGGSGPSSSTSSPGTVRWASRPPSSRCTCSRISRWASPGWRCTARWWPPLASWPRPSFDVQVLFALSAVARLGAGLLAFRIPAAGPCPAPAPTPTDLDGSTVAAGLRPS